MLTSVPLFGPIPGGPEMLIILLVLVLLFGAQKIPKLARSTGQAMGEFKKGREEVEEELQEMQGGGEEETTGVESDSGAESGASSDVDSESESESEADADAEPETEKSG